MNFKDMNLMRRLALLGGGLLLALVMLGFSCQKGRVWFSHKLHVQEQGLKCSDCHAGSEDGLHAGAPAPEVCQGCHEEAAKYSGLASELAAKWPRLKALPADGKFSHRAHQAAGVECQRCHDDVGSSKKVTMPDMPTEATCLDCHREMGVGAECAVCHQTLNRETPPADHQQAWDRLHGQAAREPVAGERCFRCHQRTSCASCHEIEKPRDHNWTWRTFGHGTEAGLDRERCAACHRSDYCVRCHQETAPQSHRGGWGSPADRHCLDCHLGESASNCAVCHSARVQHLNAPLRPNTPPHTLNTDCRACHTGFLMPHPDNGDNCKSCHKL
jgi:predicted CXXCH cytochrome family protein